MPRAAAYRRTLSAALSLGLISLAAPSTITAQTRTESGAEADHRVQWVDSESQGTPEIGRVHRGAGSREIVASVERGLVAGAQIIPGFVVDFDDPSGLTTAFSVRNEGEFDTDVTILYLDESSNLAFAFEDVTVAPKETITRNVRLELPGNPTGIVRGWIRVVSLEPITVDFFQITPGDAFAIGGQGIDRTQENSFCKVVKGRFLIGGPFSGGTMFTFIQDQPLGAGIADPPSIVASVYDEDGVLLGTANIFTDNYSFAVNASALVPGNVNFGSIDFDFKNTDNLGAGGMVLVNHDASGLYSVGVRGHCIEPVLLLF